MYTPCALDGREGAEFQFRDEEGAGDIDEDEDALQARDDAAEAVDELLLYWWWSSRCQCVSSVIEGVPRKDSI